MNREKWLWLGELWGSPSDPFLINKLTPPPGPAIDRHLHHPSTVMRREVEKWM